MLIQQWAFSEEGVGGGSVFHPGETDLKSICYWACEFTYVRFEMFDISCIVIWLVLRGFWDREWVQMGQNGENSASSYFL